MVSFTFLFKLPRYLTKSMNLTLLDQKAWVRMSVLDKHTQKAEVFAVHIQEQWDIWAWDMLCISYHGYLL